MDGSAVRLAVFADVVRKNIQIRFFYNLYGKCPGFLKAVLLILYGLKCYLSVNWGRSGPAELTFFASYPNEHVVLGHLRRHLEGPASEGSAGSEWAEGELTISRRNCLGLDAVKALPAYLAALPRLWRLARRLARRQHFLPACRIFSAVTYYARFRRLLRQRAVKAVFIANHYSPECLALAAAAHQSDRKVLFTNHANATWQEGFVPPLHCDLAVVTSRAVLETYLQDNAARVPVTYVPLAAPQKPMRPAVTDKQRLTVGIFLTALTDRARLRELLDNLTQDPQVGRILIRPHPAKVVNDDLSEFFVQANKIEETGAMPLFKNVLLCDVAICGNSTVVIELLRGGAPVLYDAALDGLTYDYNGYVKHGLVLPMESGLDAAALDNVQRFYGAPGWIEKMRYFDAGYQEDETAMFAAFNAAVRAALRRRIVTAPRAVPRRHGLDGVFQRSGA